MQTAQLLPQEKTFLRSRLYLAIGLLTPFLALAIIAAWQTTLVSGYATFLWGAVVILGIAAAMVFARLGFRLVKDLKTGNKNIFKGKIDRKYQDKSRHFIKIDGQQFQVRGDEFEMVKKGDHLEIHKSRSGVILDMQLQESKAEVES